MREPSAPERVAEIAARQHGVIASGQLREAGISPSTVSRWVATGRLIRLRRGLFAVGHRALTRDGWWHAAALVIRPEGGITGGAACMIWNVFPAYHGPIDVISPRRLHDPPAWIRSRRSRRPLEIVTRRALPVVAVAQAIVDFADTATEHDVASTLDRALQLRLIDRRTMRDAIEAAHGRHGLKHLVPAFARLAEHGELFLSETERRVRNGLLDAGLPRPQMNVGVDVPGLRRLRPDLQWEDRRLIVEIDGPQHAMPYQRWLDARRDRALAELGYRVIRFPVAEVDAHLDRVITQIAAALHNSG